MRRWTGVPASEGIAIGPVWLLVAEVEVHHRWVPAAQISSESARLDRAVRLADEQLAAIDADLSGHLEEDEGRAIVEVHRHLLRSEELVEGARGLIRDERLAADAAVKRVVMALSSMFAGVDDPYLRDRGEDVEAVGARLLRVLVGSPETIGAGAGPGSVAVGSLLSSVEAIGLRRAGLAGLATERGGKTSHAAIMVRALEVPYVLGVKQLVDVARAGDIIIVDGFRGEVILRPDGATLTHYQDRVRRQRERKLRLDACGPRAAVTCDGVHVDLDANVEAVAEIPHAIALGAEAVGLFRTEFLYLDRPDLPTEEEQYEDAVRALSQLGGRMATFRTLDLGGDKLPAAFRIPGGDNPSLGMRALRLAAVRPEILVTQLRALLRASAVAPMRIMFPMISSASEMLQVRELCRRIQCDLASEQISFDPRVLLGAMIETPGAALTVDHMADACDFFSVGTNDLVQYTLAADRDNDDVSHLYSPLHPALLRLLAGVVAAAQRAGRPLAVCGDMAADPSCTWVLLGLGFRSFSMVPSAIAAVRSVILKTTMADAERITLEAQQKRSTEEVERLVVETMSARFPLEMGAESATQAEAVASP